MCASLSRHTPGWAPLSSLFQLFPFHRRFPLLSFPGSVAIATLSLDHPAFLPPGPPLPASHQRGFTHLRGSPLKPLSEHAHGKLTASAVEVSLDIASGATGLGSSFMLLTGTVFHAKCLQKAALEQFSQNSRDPSVFVGRDVAWQTQYSGILQCLNLSFYKPKAFPK